MVDGWDRSQPDNRAIPCQPLPIALPQLTETIADVVTYELILKWFKGAAPKNAASFYSARQPLAMCRQPMPVAASPWGRSTESWRAPEGSPNSKRMKRTRPKQWSQAELTRLRAMARRKVDARKIAIALGRHTESIRRKIRELGLVPLKAASK